MKTRNLVYCLVNFEIEILGLAVLLTICFGVAVAQVCEYDHGDGRPACIQEEMNRPWRNNWDPVHYWVCINENSPAVSMSCPTDHGFLESALECVPWSQWYWTQPCNPPSGGNNGGGGGDVTTVTAPTNVPSTPIPTTPITPGPTNPPGTCYYDHGNGQPLCNAEEMNRPWRNNWDNTRYWVCESLNTPAVAVICDTNTLFYEAALACVDVPLWQWTPPCNPPSTAQ
jgi:hypothetical protein